MEEFPHLKNKKSKKRPFKKKKKKKKNKANPGFELPPIPTKPRFSRETTQFKTVKTPKRKLEMKPNSADQLDSTKKKPSRFRYQKDSNSLHFPPMRHGFH